MTQVKLLGELGEKFGTDWQCAGKSMRDILKLIDCQTPGFREYLAECHSKNIGFTFQNGEDFIEEEMEMWLPSLKDTVIISPVPAGSGKGLGKILAAIIAIIVIVSTGGTAAAASAAGGTGTTTAVATNAAGVTTATTTAPGAFGLTTGKTVTTLGSSSAPVTSFSLTGKGYAVMMLGANLGIAGITEMSAPDAGDMNDDPSFLFNGADQNMEQGQPVPVLYGTMKIGGTPISQGFAAGELRDGKINLSSGTINSDIYYYGTSSTAAATSPSNGDGTGAVQLK